MEEGRPFNYCASCSLVMVEEGIERLQRLKATLMARVRTLPQAAAWVERTGLALLFPKADVVLPSLWEQVNGSTEENWAIREPDGTFVAWTKEMGQPSICKCCRSWSWPAT